VSKNTRMLLVLAGLAVAAYLVYRWYENKQAAAAGGNSGTTGTGTNLNSVAPELVGGSTGPSIGPALQAPVTINITSTSANQNASANPVGALAPVQPQNPMIPAGVITSTSLRRARPRNSHTGTQAAAPANTTTTPATQAATAGATG
jgi:hypothetical protein